MSIIHRLAGPLALALVHVTPVAALDLQSTTVPGRADPWLTDGEIAINRADKRLIFKNADGTLGYGALLNALPSGRKAVELGDGSDLLVLPTRGSVSRSFSDLFSDAPNARTWGVTCNGSDESVKLQKAINEAGALLLLPPGVCGYSTLTIPDGLYLGCAGIYACVLSTNSATGNTITAGSAVTIERISLRTSVPRTSGCTVFTQGNSVTILHATMDGYFQGFCVGTTTTIAVRAMLDDVQFRFPAIGAGSCAAVFQNFSNAVVRAVVGTGTPSGQQPDCGLKFVNGDTAVVSDTNITRMGEGLKVAPGDGQNVYALHLNNVLFDSGGTISGGRAADACSLTPTGTGNIIETVASNLWCGLSAGHGFFAYHTGAGAIDGLDISNGQFDGNGASGFRVASANVTNWSVRGGHAAGNALSGYYVSAASTHWTLDGVKARPLTQRGSNGNAGINIANVAADYYTVVNSDVVGNTGGTFYDGGTGTNKTVAPNFK